VLQDVLAHEYRFVVLDGAGVGFLFRHSNFRQRVENGLAFDFQFSRQIVNSNLHSASLILFVALPSLAKPS